MNRQERTWANIAHFSGLLALLIPFTNIAGPLLIWLMKREESEAVGNAALEALNFQISITVYFLGLLAIYAACIYYGVFLALVPILTMMGLGLGVFNTLMIVMAVLETNRGVQYRYWLNLRVVK